MMAYGSPALEEQHKAELEALVEENAIKLDQVQVEHQKKLKMIIKEFTQRIEEKDQEYEEMLQQAISKSIPNFLIFVLPCKLCNSWFVFQVKDRKVKV